MRVLKKVRSSVAPLSHHSIGLSDQQFGYGERLIRHLLPEEVSDGISFYLRRNKFDAIITENYQSTLVFGLLTRIFGRRALHVVKELYLDEKVLASAWRRRLFRASPPRAECIIVNASSEIEAYPDFLGADREHVAFLPWPSNLPVCARSEDNGYVFAAGRSMRDWATLFASARDFEERFVVVATASDVSHLERPSNVELRCDIPRKEYLELLNRARVVVIPLVRTVRSLGQAVALEAMSMRKPLVVADAPGILDYIQDNQNGVLYRAGDSRSLSEKLRRLLASAELRRQLAEGAAAGVENKFNKGSYSTLLANLITRKVCEQSFRNEEMPVLG